jgi:hypothetical protein
LARSEDLIVEEVEDDVLVYDIVKKHAHCLGATAARVWRACDGQTDVEALSETLELSEDVVMQALDQLESTGLLESNGLQILSGSSGDGNGLSRRQFVKVGGAAAATPLIYSIAVNTPMAAATPIPFQCEIYTVQSCGTSDACGHIAGCCCCCQGGGSCKTCGSASFCSAGTQPCNPTQGGGFGAKCSTVGASPANPSGCCGVTGAKQCGCGFGPFGGCCDPTSGTACTPTDNTTTCFPCCAGQALTSAAMLGCCKSATVNCCVANPPACCGKSSQTVDCCGPNPAACCSTVGGC